MTTVAVKPVKISLLDGNRVKLHSIDAEGKEHAWVCNANHFIEFVPLAISFSNEINKLRAGLPKQTIVSNNVQEVSGGKVEGRSDVALSFTLDNKLQLHFVMPPTLAHQLYDMLSVQLGLTKVQQPKTIN